MANNTLISPSGDLIADEDVSGVKYQRIKLIDSTPGSTTPTGNITTPLTVSGTTYAQGVSADGSSKVVNSVPVAGIDFQGKVRTIATDNTGTVEVNLSNVGIGTFGNQDDIIPGITSGIFFTEPTVYDQNRNTWMRQRGDSTNGMYVQQPAGVTVSGIVTAKNTAGTPLTVSGTVTALTISGTTLNVTQTSAIAGEDLFNNVMKVEQRFSYSNVVATGTTVVKSGTGFIHNIIINNPCTLASATTETTIVLYDNTAASGTKIGTFYLPKSANIVSVMPVSIGVNASFNTGLTLAITLGTSGSWTPDITVNYR